MAGQAMWSTAESLWMLYDAGRWDEALERAARAIEWATQQEDSQVGTVGLTYSARILAHRGELDEAVGARRAIPPHRPADRRPPDPVAGARHRRRGRVEARRSGGRDRALARVRRRDAGRADGIPRVPAAGGGPHLPDCSAIVELAEALAGSRPVFVIRTKNAMSSVRALLAEMHGDHERAAAMFEAAAEGWEAWGDPFERAHALDGLARCATALARASDAERAREAASAIFAELGVPDAPADRRSGPCSSPIWSRRPKRSRRRARGWRRSMRSPDA